MAGEEDEETMARTIGTDFGADKPKILIGSHVEGKDFVRVEMEKDIMSVALQLKQFQFVNRANHL